MNPQNLAAKFPMPVMTVNLAGYQNLPLDELLRCVVENFDPGAQDYFVSSSTPFQNRNGQRVNLLDYLRERREIVAARYGDEYGDKVFDLVWDKFLNSPTLRSQNHENGSPKKRVEKQVECLNYYNALLKEIRDALGKNPGIDPYGHEELVARVVRGFVRRHCGFSLKEALRQLNDYQSRYSLRVDGVILELYFPKWFTGRKRGDFLRDITRDVDLHAPDARARLQKLIGQQLEPVRFENLENECILAECWQETHKPQIDSSPHQMKLAEAIAQEKIDRIRKLRKTIRDLGRERLRALILRIFDDLQENYVARPIAIEFGMDEVTYGRWAGIHWEKKKKKNNKQVIFIPDLWRNLAAWLVANQNDFKEAGIRAGVWEKIVKIAADRKEARHE